MNVPRLLIVLVASVLWLAGCAGLGSEQQAGEASDRDVAASPAAGGEQEEALAGDGAAEPRGDPEGPEGAAGYATEHEAGREPLPEPVAQQSGERVIKDGTMTVEVDDGEFLRAHRRVVDTARDLGGHLTDSTSTSPPDGGTSGSVTVRVPVERYEELLTRAGQIGALRSQEISSRDVTAEYTDLESRLRHLRAQEEFYLDLLEDAETVEDAIAVKQRLDGLESQIEEAQGRLGVLGNRTTYSTLTVEIVEPGAQPVVALGDARPLLADYWRTGRDGFVTVVGWLLVSGVSLSPVILPLLLAIVAWRLTRRRPGVPATVAADSD